MIKIEREEPPKNTALDNRRKEELQRIEGLAESGELKSSCIKELWSVKEDSRVKEFLYGSQYHKCCYCEKKLSSVCQKTLFFVDFPTEFQTAPGFRLLQKPAMPRKTAKSSALPQNYNSFSDIRTDPRLAVSQTACSISSKAA